MRTLPAAVVVRVPGGIRTVTATAEHRGRPGHFDRELLYVFDTAEQHKIRVVVVAKGLKHPFSIAPLPSGDALVSERGGPMRVVHNIGGATPGLRPGADSRAAAGGAGLSRWRAARHCVSPQFAKDQTALLHLQSAR